MRAHTCVCVCMRVRARVHGCVRPGLAPAPPARVAYGGLLPFGGIGGGGPGLAFGLLAAPSPCPPPWPLPFPLPPSTRPLPSISHPGRAGCAAPRQRGTSMGQLVRSLRAAHVAYYELLQPVQVLPLPVEPHQQQQQQHQPGQQEEEGLQAGAGAAAAAATPSFLAPPAAAAAAGVDAVLDEATVVLSAVLDAGEVPSIHGE